MSTGTLIAHSPKFNSKLVTVDALRSLPVPEALGARHRPVPHATLVETIHREIERRGYMVKREQLALGKDGAALFGVIDLVPQVLQADVTDDGLDVVAPVVEIDATRGQSFGFRNATDQSMSIQAVAGSRVFVCDNLALSGSMFAMKRKNSTRLDLSDAVAIGFDKFIVHIQSLEIQIERLADTRLNDARAKIVAYDAFASGVVPIRLFDDVQRNYFNPDESWTDVTPRTLFGLHNAFTRAIRDLTPTREFSASVALGKYFGMVTVDGEVI